MEKHVAKAGRKHTAPTQRFKFRPEIEELDLDPDERSNLFAVAWHRERKERYFRNLIDSADRAKMADRKWLRVSEIADALSTSPGAIIPDAAKREGSLTFVLQEMLRGEFNGQKGRSQIANLHPSPLAPVRLNTKGMKLEDIRQFTDHLWIRRQPCLDWFTRKKRHVPEDWVLSAADASNADKPLAEDCWKLSDEPPSPQKPELCRAWTVIRRIWPGGPPRSMSFQKIANRMGKGTKSFSASTIERLLKRLT
jgi:hypothetical protein